jgi:hypothetical protein
MPMDPAEQQAFLASTLALWGGVPDQPSADTAPASAPTSGIAQPGQAQPGLGMDAPPVGTQKVDAPFNESTTKTPTLAPQAVEVQQKLDAAQEKYRQAEQMTVPIEKVQPFVAPDEFEAMKAAGQTTINAGQFQDLQAKYKTQQDAKAEADFAAAEQQRAADNQKRLDQMMAAADERWRKVADMAKPENMMPSPSFATKLVQALASGLSTWANIRMGHSGPSPVDQMLDAEANREFAARKDALSAERDAAEKLGQRPKDFQAAMLEQDKMKEQRRADLYRAAALQAAKMADAFPTKARELQMQAAELEKKGLEAQRDLFVKELTRQHENKNTGEKVERVEALAGGTGKEDSRGQPTPAQVDEYTRAQLMADHMNAIDKSDLPTGEQMNQIIRNEHAIIAQNEKEAKEGQLQVTKGDIFRWFGAIPQNAYDVPGMTEKQKEAVRIITENTHALFAKRWTPGSIGIAEAYAHGMAPISPQPGDSPEQINRKFEELKEYANKLAKNLEGFSKPGIQAQKVGEAVTPEKKRVYAKPAPNPTEPPAFKPGVSKQTGSGKQRWDELPKNVREDLRRASKILTDPKATKEQKAAAQRFTKDAAEGRL